MHEKLHDQIWLNNSVRKSLFLGRTSRPLYCSYSKLRSGKSVLIHISNKTQRYTVYFVWKLLYMFLVLPTPNIRSASNCIYSIWYLSHRYCYLSL